MQVNKFSIKPDSALHRLLKMIAEEVAKEFSIASSTKVNVKSRDVKQARRTNPK